MKLKQNDENFIEGNAIYFARIKFIQSALALLHHVPVGVSLVSGQNTANTLALSSIL
jgi:hypothetical protein